MNERTDYKANYIDSSNLIYEQCVGKYTIHSIASIGKQVITFKLPSDGNFLMICGEYGSGYFGTGSKVGLYVISSIGCYAILPADTISSIEYISYNTFEITLIMPVAYGICLIQLSPKFEN